MVSNGTPVNASTASDLTAETYENTLAIRLRKAADAMEELARVILGKGGLGFVELRILNYLAANPDTSIRDLSRDLQINKAWISRLLTGLSLKGLVTKKRDASDDRIILASLTEIGRTLYQKVFQDLTRHAEAMAQGVDEALVIELLTKLELNFRRIATQLRREDRHRSG